MEKNGDGYTGPQSGHSPDLGAVSQQGLIMMRRKINWLSTAVQIGLLASSGTTLAADQVYVANEGADAVSVLDAASLRFNDAKANVEALTRATKNTNCPAPVLGAAK